MKCPGIHCPGCNSGSGTGIALVISGAIVIAWLRHSERAIDHTISDVITFLIISALIFLGIGVSIASGLIIDIIRKNRKENQYAIIQAKINYLQSIDRNSIENINNISSHRVYVHSEQVEIKRNKTNG